MGPPGLSQGTRRDGRAVNAGGAPEPEWAGCGPIFPLQIHIGSMASPTKAHPTGAPAPEWAGHGPRRVAMLLAYDGSLFHGWQVQDHCITVQAKLEEALRTVTQLPVKVYGSGRTDAGVHALNQVAHCDLPRKVDLHELQRSLNALAAPGIAVKALVEVPPHFHARHSAIGKIYRYHIFNRAYPPVFARHHCWWIRAPLDAGAMGRAAAHFIGTHDFSAFRAKECAAATPVRTLHRIDFAEGEWADSTLRIEMEGSGFLQHMARIVSGTLAAVGRGRCAPEEIPNILASRERSRAAMTAPGRGLHLVRVHYDEEAFPQLRMLNSGACEPDSGME